MAPKHQSSLTSFFGSAPAGAQKGSKPAKAPTTTAPKSKENVGNKTTNKAPSPDKKHVSPTMAAKEDLRRKKRRVIDDDDEDDDDEDERMTTPTESKTPSADNEKETKPERKDESRLGKETENEKLKEKKPETTSTTIIANKPDKSLSPSKAASESTKSDTKNDDNDDDDSAAKQQPHASSAMLALAPKDSVPSDAKILKQIPETSWPGDTKSLPYLFLCQSLAEIEGITARLQIQSILTKLLRQVLLRHPADLYPLIYLASNSVAPAYECVELGIGDSLLIKAIGEATGTNPNMVKSKYETVGDLGTVAMSFKGKQKKIGGFFQSAAGSKPKPKLSAAEVLTVFREIASTKGNQAQKWKVDKIKKLLVKATDALETKYIIRGLQGKLRIGLAESTVLIALAHSLALTTPETVEKPTEKIKKSTCVCDSTTKFSFALCRLTLFPSFVFPTR